MDIDEFVKDWREKNNTEDAVYSSYHYDAMEAYAKEKVKEYTDFLWANHNDLRDANKNKVALEEFLESTN